jgi:molybdopterin/thiamine biosynthesis adenylyltransferase
MRSETFKPLIFRSISEYDAFQPPDGVPVLVNSMESQLKELVTIRNPQIPLKGEHDAIKTYINEHLAGQEIATYGLWVFYPWINTVVRTLPEAEFIELRTNRNKYKITDEEFEGLQSKKLGIVGLSVGRAVAMTAAMERICSTIRLADFDTLELSNLNRIRTSLTNLGINKAISVAREIALLDPFIDVQVFTDGLTEDNMDEFYGEGPNQLDILVEACDELEIKIISRFKAREKGIPVIMEASDRCVVDVERFDLEPERPILHNLLGDIDIQHLKSIKTDEDKIPILMALNGNESLSPRIRASALEISQTINTWPQLASAVSLGGGVLTDVIRRIFTEEFTDSGRYYVDVQQLIANKEADVSKHFTPILNYKAKGITQEEMVEMAEQVGMKSNDSFPSKSELDFMVGAAHKAPSGGNSQPWKWLAHNNNLFLFHDRSLSESYLDYKYEASVLSFGAATENLKLAAAEKGWDVDYTLYPTDDDELIATFSFEKSGNGSSYRSNLANIINDRTTNRKILMSAELEQAEYQKLEDSIIGIPGAKVRFYRDYETKVNIGNMMGSMDRVRVLFKETHLDMVREIRWNPEEAESTKDGIDVATLEMPESILAGLKMAKDPRVVDLLSKWDKGYALEGLMQYYAMFSDGIGMISHEDIGQNTYFEGGRAVERIWLAANLADISFQPISACIFLFNRFEKEGKKPFGEFGNAVEVAYNQYKQIFEISEKERRIFIFRLFKGEEPSVRALRRDLNEHLIYT